MLEVIEFLVSAVERYVIWLYIACLAGIIYNLRAYVVARQARADTIFTVERETAAYREGRAMSNIGLLLGLVAIVLVVQFYVLPSVDTTVLVQETVTPTLALATSTPRPTMPPTLSTVEEEQTPTREAVPVPTSTPRPTATPDVTATPVTPQPPASPCADPNTCIVSPGSNAVVRGSWPSVGRLSTRHSSSTRWNMAWGRTPRAGTRSEISCATRWRVARS